MNRTAAMQLATRGRVIGDVSDITSDPIQQAALVSAVQQLGQMVNDPGSFCASGNGAVLAVQQLVNQALGGTPVLQEDGAYGPDTAGYCQDIDPSMPAGCVAYGGSFGGASTPSTGNPMGSTGGATTLPPVNVSGSSTSSGLSKGAKIGLALGGVVLLGVGWHLFAGD